MLFRSNAYFRESLRIFAGLGHQRGIAKMLEALAGCASLQGRPHQAFKLAGAAAAIRERVGTGASSPGQRGGERQREAWRAGFALDTDAAVAYALEPDDAA